MLKAEFRTMHVRMGALCVTMVSVTVAEIRLPAQATQPKELQRPRVGQAVRSPVVQADGRVIFRFRAPGATKVSLARDGLKLVAMTKDAQGVWSITTDPLAPDLYLYQFVVDGVVMADPANPLSKPVVTGGAESIVHVPNVAAESWEPHDVPHGVLHRHCNPSKIIGEDREFWVYTPPGYDPSAGKTYPVLYLLHGVMDDASAWTTAGRAHVILDNLIAAGKAKPMLVVMPFGYGLTNVPDRMAEQFGPPRTQRKIMDVFSRYLIEELIPNVEREYRVAKDRDARAIAGLSMGGAQALFIGLNHPDRFSWIGSFSGALIMYDKPFEKWFPSLTAKTNPPVQLLWVACGTQDFLLGTNRKFQDWLKSNKIAFTAVETSGSHAWTVWRRNLIEFAPLLFR
jgi:enterochelin esterase-like enzyme